MAHYQDVNKRIRANLNKHGPYPHKKACKLYPEIAGTRCWVYEGTIDARGYPQMSIKNKTRKLHRLIGKRKFGKLTKKQCICHKCDVKHCLRASHYCRYFARKYRR